MHLALPFTSPQLLADIVVHTLQLRKCVVKWVVLFWLTLPCLCSWPLQMFPRPWLLYIYIYIHAMLPCSKNYLMLHCSDHYAVKNSYCMLSLLCKHHDSSRCMLTAAFQSPPSTKWCSAGRYWASDLSSSLSHCHKYKVGNCWQQCYVLGIVLLVPFTMWCVLFCLGRKVKATLLYVSRPNVHRLTCNSAAHATHTYIQIWAYI